MTKPSSTLAVFAFLILTLVAQIHAFAQSETSGLITIEPGDLPIILSSPHGGSKAIPGVPERQGKGVRSFRKVTDQRTDKLTLQLADAIEDKMGKRPHVVIAHFHRKYLDANRHQRDAFESPKASAAYNEYHNAIADAKQAIADRWGHGLLLDIHGQATEPTTIFRGTQNGGTTAHLISRFGIESLRGPSSLFGQFANQGLRVVPKVGDDGREHVDFDGGYIVRTHGSRTGGTIDAIQLELGRALRDRDAIASTSDKIANAVVAFAADYLPKDSSERKANRASRSMVRVGVYHDIGTGASVDDLLEALGDFKNVSVRELKADDIRAGDLAKLDVLIQPGGSGSKQARHLGEGGREEIREFVEEGGGFIGICAGAYLASADYEWSLNVLDAKVVDRKHWARGKGVVQLSLTEAGRRVLERKNNLLEIYYAQGPLLAPKDNPEIEDYETIATYKTEIAKNGAAKGVMTGTTAIAKGRFGRGRVFCFSPHPEMTDGLEELVHLAIGHVKRRRPESIGK